MISPPSRSKTNTVALTAVLAAAVVAAWAETSAPMQGVACSLASAVPAVSAGRLLFTGKYRGNESVPVFVLKTGPACCGYRANRWGNALAICQALHPVRQLPGDGRSLDLRWNTNTFFLFFFGTQMRQRR